MTEHIAFDLIDQAQLADALGVSERTLEKWRQTAGGPPFLKLGGLVRYRRASVEAWLASQEQAAS